MSRLWAWGAGDVQSVRRLASTLAIGVVTWTLIAVGGALYYVYARPVHQVRHCTLIPDPARTAGVRPPTVPPKRRVL
jgi:hypothetical protein